MTSNPTARAGTALSPEWDHGFDEAFTELVCADPELVRAEFDALIGAGFDEPPPSPPDRSAGQPAPSANPGATPKSAAADGGPPPQPDNAGHHPRPPP